MTAETSREEMQRAGLPWLLQEDRYGIEITNERGETVHNVQWSDIPDDRGPAFAEQMIALERSIAQIIVTGANRLAAKPADEGVRERIIQILRSQIEFSRLAKDVSAFVTNAPEVADKILKVALSTTGEPKQ